MATYGNGANYSTTSDDLLCSTCKYSQIVESAQGGTAIICHYAMDDTSTPGRRIDMLVTRCNRYKQPDVLRLWDTSIALMQIDGHVWLADSKHIAALCGHFHVRADTYYSRQWVLMEFPGHVWDANESCWIGKAPVKKNTAKARTIRSRVRELVAP